MNPTVRVVSAFLLPLLFAGLSARASDENASADRSRQPSGTGGLTGFTGDGLDLIGRMAVRFPWRTGGDAFRFDWTADTHIANAPSDLEFLVRELDYRGTLRWSPAAGRRAFVAAGQWGRERVDADGQPWVRWVGAGFERADRNANGPWWDVRGGPVLDDREVDADAVLFAEGGWRFGRWDARIDADALIGDGADVQLGVGRSWSWGDARRLRASIGRYRSGSRFGLGDDGWLLGLEIAERSDGPVADPSRGTPQIWGEAAFGLGDARAGRLVAGAASPPIGRDWTLVFVVDARALTADETGDLYYLYHVGAERPWSDHARWGAWFYHRSNHRLAEPGTGVTSLNAVETGAESAGWDRPLSRPERWSWRLRVGALVDADVGNAWEPIARGGAGRRFGALDRVVAPFVRAAGETGPVDRWTLAFGVKIRERFEVRAEWSRDDQWFRTERDAWTIVGAAGF